MMMELFKAILLLSIGGLLGVLATQILQRLSEK